jgi:hypothetical protein
MNSDEIQSLVVKVLIMILTATATALHLSPDSSSIATAAADLASLGAFAYGVYIHWNMRKVPEKSIITGQAGSVETARVLSAPNIGGRPDGANRGGLASAIVIGALVTALCWHGQAYAASAPPIIIAKSQTPIEFNSIVVAPGASTQAAATGALSGALGDIVNFFATDFDDAATLATQIPALQDNNGRACWQRLSSVGVLLKAHPLPVTFKAATDLEALRLFSMALNQTCGDPACTQVFTDLSTGISQLGVGIPVPSLTQICGKIPTITPGPAPAPVAAAAPAAN